MKQICFFGILFGLLTLCVYARETTTWEAIPATPRGVDESSVLTPRSTPRPMITTRASVYDTQDLGGPSVTWGNVVVKNPAATNLVVTSRSGETQRSPIQLVSAVVPQTQPLASDEFGAFNSPDVMPLAPATPPQRIVPSMVQQPTSFHRWELDTGNDVNATRAIPHETPLAPVRKASAETQRPSVPVVEVPAIDMQQNPKYAKFLPNTMPCGVVLIQSDFKLQEVESVAREIALLQEDLLDYLAVPAPREKIDLCLFSSRDSYVKFLQALFPNAPTDRPALFIKRPGEPATLLVQRDANFEIDLRHEMTHAILHARIDNVPMWLDEGLAKYLELPRQQRPYNTPYLKTVKWQSNLWMTSSLTRLESLKYVDDMASREYRDSWAWIHFLIHHSPETHQFLALYLQMLAVASDAKQTRVPSMSHELSQAIDNPKSAMRAHFSRWPLPTTQQASNTINIDETSEGGSLTTFFSKPKREKPTESDAPPKVAATEDATKKWYQFW